MAQRHDPLAMILKAAADPDHDPLVLSGTLQVLDESGIPVDYIAGDQLVRNMEQVIRRAWGPVNAERRRRLAAVADWRLRPALVGELTAIIVEPLMLGLSRDDAPLLHLSTRIMRLGLLDMQEALWWTPLAIERLRAGNQERAGPAPGRGSLAKTVAYANYLCYHFVTESIARRDLPLGQREDGLLAGHSEALARLVRGLLMTMLG